MSRLVHPPPRAKSRSTPDIEKLVELLSASLQRLAAAGDVEGACRLAGQACAAVRLTNPVAEHRFNALLHRLCKPRPAERNVDRLAPQDADGEQSSATAPD